MNLIDEIIEESEDDLINSNADVNKMYINSATENHES